MLPTSVRAYLNLYYQYFKNGSASMIMLKGMNVNKKWSWLFQRERGPAESLHPLSPENVSVEDL